jgi:hypothetical protein
MKESYIPVTYCDVLRASVTAGVTNTYQLLFTIHQYEVCKHKRTRIRLIVTLPKIQLLWNYSNFVPQLQRKYGSSDIFYSTKTVNISWERLKKIMKSPKECPVSQCQDIFLRDVEIWTNKSQLFLENII